MVVMAVGEEHVGGTTRHFLRIALEQRIAGKKRSIISTDLPVSMRKAEWPK